VQGACHRIRVAVGTPPAPTVSETERRWLVFPRSVFAPAVAGRASRSADTAATARDLSILCRYPHVEDA
jgi:hypothetical protein